MRNRKTQGFTLIELLIVIAIIGILAAVLIPNLLNARARAFDTAAQTCLKEIATNEEMAASVTPWNYTNGQFARVYDATGLAEWTTGTGDPGDPVVNHQLNIGSCANITVAAIAGSTSTSSYGYTGFHRNGQNIYRVITGSGVVFDSAQ